MEIQIVSSSYPINSRSTKVTLPWAWNHKGRNTTISFKTKISYGGCASHGQQWERTSFAGNRKLLITKAKKSSAQSRGESIKGSEKQGTVVGAVALIVGTSIGTGILALPKKTSPAGFIPSAVSMILCWGFLLIEALPLAEINVGLLKKKKKKKKKKKREEKNEVQEVISIRTMAQETLGEWGGALATVNYVFLGYTSMVVYTSKSAEILYHLINLPTAVSGILFTTLFTILVSVGGTRTTAQVNQWLTASLLGLLAAIEVQAILSGGWLGLEVTGNWEKVPSTIPVIIFSLVYHDLVPVICAYLDGDLKRTRASIALGSLVPLLAMLLWDAITLGLSNEAGQVVDPVELLMRVSWGGVSVMVEAFSLLAVGTSIIGTLLSFSRFFVEQLSKLPWYHPLNLTQKSGGSYEPSFLRHESVLFGLGKWWGSNKLSFTATAMAVAPPLFVSTTVPDAFSAATDFAGGYCMTMLYGVLPPAMAWAMHTSSCGAGVDNDNDDEEEDSDQKALFRAKPAILGAGLFACGIIMIQILQDLLMWNP